MGRMNFVIGARASLSMASDETPSEIENLLDNPGLAEALESDRFKEFLDKLLPRARAARAREREKLKSVQK
jgi:hypothetical protein